jgi:ABC-type multidrug transport system ATPase subunit
MYDYAYIIYAFVKIWDEPYVILCLHCRRTWAVELVANPLIISMDKQTSGLDARAADIVMQTVRNITVDTGRMVVCTIHQPSIDIFESFDELLLLKLNAAVKL